MASEDGFDTLVRAQLEAARASAGRPLSAEQVLGVVQRTLQSQTTFKDGSARGVVDADLEKIFSELHELHRVIQSTRHEIAALRPDEIGRDFIPVATDELDAVVGATEDATGKIMDAAERIMTLADQAPEAVSTALVDEATKIFEASSFQDITGQRITKVVNTLKHIESRIDALVAVIRVPGGADAGTAPPTTPAPNLSRPSASAEESALLNGPQLPGGAIDQDEIDRLLSEFD